MSFEKLAKIACYEGAGAVILGRGHSDYGVEEPSDFNNGTGDGGTHSALLPRRFASEWTWRREKSM